MSKEVDEKVVEMRFDNSNFEKNVKESMSTLEKLKQSLNLDTAVEKVKTAQSLLSKINIFSGLDDGIVNTKIKFDGLRVFAEQMVRNLANTFYAFGSKMASSIISPITEGGMRRALNIEQAKFQLEGLHVAWKDIEEDISYAVDGTAYGLDVAAKAASQLTASGVQMGDQMKAALRGISGVAAMTNAAYEEISPIFTTVAGQGKLMTMQLRQLENRGINAAATMAEYFNNVNSGIVEASDEVKVYINQLTGGLATTEADIRDFVTKGKINFNVFSEAMNSAFGEHAKDANKTFTGALSNMKAALARIGANIAEQYMNNAREVFNSLRLYFNAINKGLEPLTKGANSFIGTMMRITKTGIVRFVNDLTAITEKFSELGGFNNIVESLYNIFKALYMILAPVGDAFKDVFTPIESADRAGFLVRITETLKKFTESLIISDETANAIRYTFKGLFSIFKMAFTVLSSIGKTIAPALETIFTMVLKISGAISMLIANFVNWAAVTRPLSKAIIILKNSLLLFIGVIVYGISSIIDWIKNSTLFGKAIDKLDPIIKNVKNRIRDLYDWGNKLLQILKKGDPATLGTKIKNHILEPINRIYANIKTNHPVIYSMLNGTIVLINIIKDAALGFFNTIKNVGLGIVDIIKDGITSIQNKDIPGFLQRLKQRIIDFGNAVFGVFNKTGMDPDSISDKLSRLGNTIKDFFKNIDPGTIIAFAFSAALINLIINLSKFTKGLQGFVGAATSLIEKLKEPFEKINTVLESKIVQFTGFVIAVTAALKILSEIPRDDLLQSAAILGVFVGTMIMFTAAMTILDKKMKIVEGGGISSMASSIYAMSASILSVSIALKILQGVTTNFTDIAVKLGGIIIVLGAIGSIAVLLSRFAGERKILASTISVLALSAGVLAISIALSKLSNLPLDNLKDNLSLIISIMTILGVLALAMSQIKFTGVVGILLLCTNIDMILGALEKTLGNETFKATLAGIENGIKRFAEFAYTEWRLLAAAIGAMVTITGAITIQLYYLSRATQNVGKAFFGVAAGFLIITAAMTIMDKVNISQGAKDFAVMFLVLSGLISALLIGISQIDALDEKTAEAKAKGIENTIKAIGRMMMAIGISMLLMLPSMYVFSKLSWQEFLKPIIVLAEIFAGLAVIVGLSKRLENVKAGPIIAIMTTLAIIFAEMVVLSTLKTEKLIAAGVAIGIGMLSLARILDSLSELSQNSIDFKKILSILGECIIISGLIVTLGYSIAEISKYSDDWTKIAAAGGSISVGMLALGYLLNIISKSSGLGNASTASRKALVLLAVTVPIAALGGSIGAIAATAKDWDTVAASGLAIVAGIGMLALILDRISSMQVNGSITQKLGLMVGVAGMVAVLGATLAIVSSSITDFTNFVAASVAVIVGVSAILAVMTLIMEAPIDTNPVALVGKLLSMITAIGMVVAIGHALSQVAQFDWKNILASMAAISVVIGVLNGLVIAMGAVFAGLANTGVGILGLLVVVAVLGEIALQMYAFAAAANAFAVAVTAVVNGISIAAQGFALLIPQLQSLAQLDLLALGGGLIVLGIGIGAVGAAGIVLGIGALGIVLAAAGIGALGLAIQLFNGVDLVVLAAGMVFLKEALEGIVFIGIQGIIAAVGIGALSASLLVLSASLRISSEAFKMTMEVIDLSFTTKFAKLSADSIRYGIMIAAGLSLGMAQGIPGVVKSISSLVTTIKNGITGPLGIHSPSEWAKTALEFFGLGAEEGIGASIYGVAKAMDGFCKDGLQIPLGNGLNGMTDMVNNWFSGFSSTMSKFAKMVNGMIAGSSAKLDATSAYVAGLTGKTVDLKKATSQYSDILGSLMKPFEDLGNSASGLKMDVGDLTSGIGDYSSAVGGGGGSGRGSSASAATEDLTNSMEDLGESANYATENIEETKNAVAELADKIRGQINIFKEFSKGQEISAEDMLKNMRSQVQGVAEWAANLRILAQRGISDGLLRELTDLGPQGYAEVAAFVEMTEAQLAEASDLFGMSLALPDATAQWLVEQFGIVGRDVSLGFVEGIDPRCADERAWLMGMNTLNAVKDALDSHSPSRAMYQVGMDVCLGMNQGIGAYAGIPAAGGNVMGFGILSAVKSMLDPVKFTEIGTEICNGIRIGIDAGRSRVIDAAVNMATQTYQAAKKALDINSPSRKFRWLGIYTGEGLSLGIDDSTEMVKNSSQNMANSALDTMRKSLGQIDNILNNSYDYNPVITPVLDLSNLDTGFRQIDGMMQEKKYAMYGEKSNIQNPSGNSYNFVQNNYSPKALSRVEIYRQTRSQFSQFKKTASAQ